jgi:hypothetical protein
MGVNEMPILKGDNKDNTKNKPQPKPTKYTGRPSNVGFNKGAALRKGQNRRGV